MSTWLAWLAAKMTGASRCAQVLVAPDGGRGDDPGERPGHVVEHHRPDQADRVAAGPLVVVVEADLALGRRALDPGRPVRRAAAGTGAGRADRSDVGAVSLHVGHEDRRGVQVGEGGRGPDHVARDLERVGEGRRRARSRAGAPPSGRRRPRSPGPGARGRARTSTTCRRGGRRGRRGRSGRGGCTTGRWRRTPRRACASRSGRSSRSGPARRSRCSSGGRPGRSPTWSGAA